MTLVDETWRVAPNDERTGSRHQALAVAALYRKHRHGLRRFFQRRKFDSSDCDELLQTTFLRFLATGTGPQAEVPEAYLYVVARTVATDHARSRQRRARYESAVALQLETVEWRTPERDVECRQSLAKCLVVISRQAPRMQLVFERKRLDEWKVPRIADEAGISGSGVEKAVAAVTDRLFDAVSGDWKFDGLGAYEWRLHRRG